jgi:hypothetical protein
MTRPLALLSLMKPIRSTWPDSFLQRPRISIRRWPRFPPGGSARTGCGTSCRSSLDLVSVRCRGAALSAASKRRGLAWRTQCLARDWFAASAPRCKWKGGRRIKFRLTRRQERHILVAGGLNSSRRTAVRRDRDGLAVRQHGRRFDRAGANGTSGRFMESRHNSCRIFWGALTKRTQFRRCCSPGLRSFH